MRWMNGCGSVTMSVVFYNASHSTRRGPFHVNYILHTTATNE